MKDNMKRREYNGEIENPTPEDFEAFGKQIRAMLLKDDPNYVPRSTEEYLEELRKTFED